MIKEVRKKNNYTQRALAVELGVTQQTISQWENELCDPPIEVLKKLSEIFCCTIDELVKGE